MTEYVRNVDKRRKFIKSFGKDRFMELARTDPSYRKLLPYRVPDGHKWLWHHFQRIWRDSEHDMMGYPVITPASVLAYMEYYGVDFDAWQRDLIMRMKGWAIETVAELKDKRKGP